VSPAAARRIRVLVVDDSAFVRRALTRMLGAAPDLEVVGLAVDGQDALEQVRALHPDVVTLDVQMPRLDGLRALERLMRERPTPVLLMSSLTREGAEVTLRGLELGALDFVDKGRAQGNMGLLALSEELRAKVRALAGATARATPGAAPAPRARLAAGAAARVDAVAVAASTGGPAALQALIPRLPAALPAALLVVQHIPPGFTRSLAERLDARSALAVSEAVEGEEVRPGRVLIAPAGRHMRVERRQGRARVRFVDEPRDALHRPSADVLMGSVAEAYGARSLGVVLTGMGSDGALGLGAIRAAGGVTLAQSEESCVIYGMPKAAVDAGVVDRQVALEALADEILATL
jgi:two-component system chemotaxis response regulator CheB